MLLIFQIVNLGVIVDCLVQAVPAWGAEKKIEVHSVAAPIIVNHVISGVQPEGTQVNLIHAKAPSRDCEGPLLRPESGVAAITEVPSQQIRYRAPLDAALKGDLSYEVRRALQDSNLFVEFFDEFLGPDGMHALNKRYSDTQFRESFQYIISRLNAAREDRHNFYFPTDLKRLHLLYSVLSDYKVTLRLNLPDSYISQLRHSLSLVIDSAEKGGPTVWDRVAEDALKGVFSNQFLSSLEGHEIFNAYFDAYIGVEGDFAMSRNYAPEFLRSLLQNFQNYMLSQENRFLKEDAIRFRAMIRILGNSEFVRNLRFDQKYTSERIEVLFAAIGRISQETRPLPSLNLNADNMIQLEQVRGKLLQTFRAQQNAKWPYFPRYHIVPILNAMRSLGRDIEVAPLGHELAAKLVPWVQFAEVKSLIRNALDREFNLDRSLPTVYSVIERWISGSGYFHECKNVGKGPRLQVILSLLRAYLPASDQSDLEYWQAVAKTIEEHFIASHNDSFQTPIREFLEKSQKEIEARPARALPALVSAVPELDSFRYDTHLPAIERVDTKYFPDIPMVYTIPSVAEINDNLRTMHAGMQIPATYTGESVPLLRYFPGPPPKHTITLDREGRPRVRFREGYDPKKPWDPIAFPYNLAR